MHFTGRVQETTTGERFEPQNLKSFNPVTQELYQLLPTIIHNKNFTEKLNQNRPLLKE
jgi:hypothetical protein